MIKRAGFAVASLLAVAGCATEIGSSPDRYRTSSPHDALEGVPYALPMLQYQLEITRALNACQTEFVLTVGEEDVVVTRGAPSLGLTAKATERYVPGERYVANYRSLNAPFSTAAFTLELHENGVLKSVNVSAEDKSSKAIASAVTLGLNIAGLSTPGVAAAPRAFVNNTDNKSLTDEDALAQLVAGASSEKRVVCVPDTVKTLIAIKAIGETRKKETPKLRGATKDVERLTIVANMRHAQTTHVDALSKALADQSLISIGLEDLATEKEKLTKGLNIVTKRYWPERFDEESGPLSMSNIEISAFQEQLAVRNVITLKAADVAAWIRSLPPGLQTTYRADPRFKPYLREDGSAAEEEQISAVCGGSAADVEKCLRSQFDGSIYLREAIPRVDCAQQNESAGCIERAADVHEIDTVGPVYRSGGPRGTAAPAPAPSRFPAGRHANDAVADPGVFVRMPVEGQLRICRGVSETCTGDDEILKSDPTTAPQLGQLRFLPFRNEMFEGTSLALTLRDNGSIEKLEYKTTTAAGAEALATAASTVDAYSKWRHERDSEAATRLTADRAAQIASLQFEIDLLKKQEELLKLQSPESSDALDAIREQTEAIKAEVALKEAKIADLRATATLSELSQ